jgi:ribosomal protein S18 acetylase RimI-like enzyme
LIDIVPADANTAFKEFLHLPYTLYSEDPQWVPPLMRDIRGQFSGKNPFFEHAEIAPFIARLDGETVGRITAIYNTAHMDFTGEKAGFFGFFDCINDVRIARALFEMAQDWLKGKNMHVMRGPMNFSSNEEWGLLIDGYDSPPMLLMPYNFSYLRGLFESCGFTKAKDLYAYIYDIPELLPEKTYRVEKFARRQGVRVRPMNIKSFKSEMQVFKDIYNSTWEKNWGFIPMTEEEIDFTAKKLKPLIIPDLALIAEWNGKPVGFMMFLPDFNYVLKRLNGRLFPFGIVKALWYSRKIQDTRLLLLGIREGFRRRGIDAVLLSEGLKALKKHGFRRVEFSWVLEDNYPVQRIIDTVQGRLYKKYRIYEKKL